MANESILSDEMKQFYTKAVLKGARKRIVFEHLLPPPPTDAERAEWQRNRLRLLRQQVQQKNRKIVGRPKEPEQGYGW